MGSFHSGEKGVLLFVQSHSGMWIRGEIFQIIGVLR